MRRQVSTTEITRNSLLTRTQMPLIALALVTLLAACSGKTTASKYPSNIEVVTQLEQSKEEILETPLQFPVALEAESSAWGRARAFFDLYLRPKYPKIEVREQAHQIQNRDKSTPFTYRVARQLGAGEMVFTVSCELQSPSRSADSCDMNARNLARFIQRGVLERELLVY